MSLETEETTSGRAPLAADAIVPWTIGSHELVPVVLQNAEVAIRTLWSPALALELKTRFRNKEEAQELINRIYADGKIYPEPNWKKLFKPSDNILVDNAFEPSTVAY